MSKLLLATLLGLGALASSPVVHAQSRSDVRQIEQEYARTHGGQQISDSQLDYYLDQMGRGWSMNEVRADMSGYRGDGNNTGYNNNGYNNGNNNSNNGWRPRQGWSASSVVCSSQDRRYHECRVPFRGRAQLVNQISDASCVEGRTWGEKPGVVWVNNGCRARFSVSNNGRGGYGGRPGDPQWNNDYMVTCSSTDNRQTRCEWDERYGQPRINKQLSQARCIAGRTWDYDNRDLWVSNGCRATFIPNNNRR
jgi:hypothetical protein